MSNRIPKHFSTPRTVIDGIKDESAVSIAMPVESTPLRFPFFASFSPIGSYDEPLAVSSETLGLTHGSELLDARSKFFNHQTLFMRSHFQGGGTAIFHRLKADGSAMAGARLGIDLVADELIEYERNADGTYRRNSSGELVPTGNTIEGYRAQWRVVPIPTISGEYDFGRGTVIDGDLVSGKDGTISDFYPIMDIEGRWDGAMYNNVGFRLSAPSALSRDAIDEDLVERLEARPYRLQVVRRSSEKSSPTIVPTRNSEQYLNFTFVDAIDESVGTKEYNIARTYLNSFENENPELFVGYGPFGALKVYDDNLETVLTLLAEEEASHLNEDVDNIHMFNFITGSDLQEIPYYTYRVEGPRDGGVLLSETTSHFLVGGADGDVSTEALNSKWTDLLETFADNPLYTDIARMPFDSVWDSGFPIDTKVKFINVHNARPDVFVHVCTQDVSRPLNTPSEDTSVSLTLRSVFRAQIESAEYGTKATRFAVFNCAGYLPDDDYKGIVPFMEYICNKGAQYMGAAIGKFNPLNSFGRGAKNVVTRYINHNGGLKPLMARNTDWNNGVNYPEFYDMKRLFYPGLQSIHEDHTSALHSYFNVQIACNLFRIGHVVWREMSGDDRLDDLVFLQEVERIAKEKSFEAFDGRVIPNPKAYYTALDTALGTHWHMDWECEFKNIKTTQVLTVISQRARHEEA